MAEFNQFGAQNSQNRAGGMGCAECEAMLTDALDNALTPDQQARFDLHLLGCTDCAAAYEDAQRGAAWLEMLKSDPPQPTAALMARILEQTSGTIAIPAFAGMATAAPASQTGWAARVGSLFTIQGLKQVFLQPRLAMTAAMAFFSITLTLNLAGVHITELRASDLAPSNIRRTLYQTNARVVRYYDNLRVVYELESRVKEMRSDEDSKPQPQPTNNQQQEKKDDKNQDRRPGGGSSRKEPLNGNYVLTAQVAPKTNRQDVTSSLDSQGPSVATPSGMPERGVA